MPNYEYEEPDMDQPFPTRKLSIPARFFDQGYYLVHKNAPTDLIRFYRNQRAAKVSLAAWNRNAGEAAYYVTDAKGNRLQDIGWH